LTIRPKIDEIDIRILRILLNDARTSFAEIAKNCGMSTNTIRMRVNRLKKDGVITGAVMPVNPKSLGYNCIGILRIQADANKEKSVYDFMVKIPEIIHIFQPIGKHNIQCYTALKNVNELAQTIEQIKTHPHVLGVSECIWIDAAQVDHPENLVIETFGGLQHKTKLLHKEENQKLRMSPSHVDEVAEKRRLEESYELDKIDMAIIRILSRNADMPFRKIAKKVGVSAQTVIRRYKRMRKSVLPYASITLDMRKLGYTSKAIFHIKTSPQYTISSVINKLVRVPNVIVACRCVGALDIFVTSPFSSFKQLLKVKQGISKTPGVKQMEVFIDEPFSSWPLTPSASLLPNQQ
jgi:DNA-binding Lrp family transcriptional regulator